MKSKEIECQRSYNPCTGFKERVYTHTYSLIKKYKFLTYKLPIFLFLTVFSNVKNYFKYLFSIGCIYKFPTVFRNFEKNIILKISFFFFY